MKHPPRNDSVASPCLPLAEAAVSARKGPGSPRLHEPRKADDGDGDDNRLIKQSDNSGKGPTGGLKCRSSPFSKTTKT